MTNRLPYLTKLPKPRRRKRSPLGPFIVFLVVLAIILAAAWSSF